MLFVNNYVYYNINFSFSFFANKKMKNSKDYNKQYLYKYLYIL